MYTANFIRTILLSALIFTASPASAISEQEASEFVAQIDALMNRRNMGEISRFYKFYADKKAMFIKDSTLVDPHDNDTVIGEESLSMNVDEYLVYLKGILTTPDKYAYSSQIDSITLNKAQNTATVELTVMDSSVTYGYDEEQKRNYSTYVLATSNCNYSLSYKSAHFYLLGMNCVEKINKSVVY